MPTDVTVPTLGESITEATLGQWLKQPGDAVAADEPLASLETDKVAVEVNAPAAGVMGEQLVSEGDNVAVGAVIARIETNGAAAAPAAAPASAPAAAPAISQEVQGGDIEAIEEGGEDEGSSLTLSPSVRRLVLEHGLDPSRIKGTGKDGRLTKDDVLNAARAQKVSGRTPAAPPPPERARESRLPRRERAGCGRRRGHRPW